MTKKTLNSPILFLLSRNTLSKAVGGKVIIFFSLFTGKVSKPDL